MGPHWLPGSRFGIENGSIELSGLAPFDGFAPKLEFCLNWFCTDLDSVFEEKPVPDELNLGPWKDEGFAGLPKPADGADRAEGAVAKPLEKVEPAGFGWELKPGAGFELADVFWNTRI